MAIKTVAGALLGEGRNCVVRYDDELSEVIARISLRGRWLYTRKCQRDEQIGGIYLPDFSRANTAFALVLGVGDRCDKNEKWFRQHTKAELRLLRAKRDWMPQVCTDAIVPGETRILCPDDHDWGIMRSPYEHDEYFIHECIAKCFIDKD